MKKTLKLMAIVALVAYGSSAFALSQQDINSLNNQKNSAVMLKNQGKYAAARTALANVISKIDDLIADPSLTDDQISELVDIQTEAQNALFSIPSTL